MSRIPRAQDVARFVGARRAEDVEPELARGVGPDLPHVLDARSMIYVLRVHRGR